MVAALFVFILVSGGIIGAYYAATWLPGFLAARKLERRLHDVSFGAADPEVKDDSSILKQAVESPIPGIDKVLAKSNAGSRLARLIELSGVKTTPGAVVMMSLMAALIIGFIARIFVANPLVAPLAGLAASTTPFLWLTYRKS